MSNEHVSPTGSNSNPNEDSVPLPDFLKYKSDVIVENDLRFDPSACAPDLFIFDQNTHLRKTVDTVGHLRIIDRAQNGFIMIGIVSSAFDVSLFQYLGETTSSYAYYANNGHKYHNGTKVALTSELPKNGDVIGVLLDLDARTLTYFKNGQILGTAFGQIPLPDSNTKYYPAITFYELGHWVSLIKTTK